MRYDCRTRISNHIHNHAMLLRTLRRQGNVAKFTIIELKSKLHCIVMVYSKWFLQHWYKFNPWPPIGKIYKVYGNIRTHQKTKTLSTKYTHSLLQYPHVIDKMLFIQDIWLLGTLQFCVHQQLNSLLRTCATSWVEWAHELPRIWIFN